MHVPLVGAHSRQVYLSHTGDLELMVVQTEETQMAASEHASARRHSSPSGRSASATIGRVRSKMSGRLGHPGQGVVQEGNPGQAGWQVAVG